MVIKRFLLEDSDDIIDLINSIYGSEYLEREFYDKEVISHYIKYVNYERGGAWKGLFFKDELVAQMLAIIENSHVILKLTMIKENYRNMGLMMILSASMIKEIDHYKNTDFKTIFAFVSPSNLPILKILHQFKFIEVGTVPSYDIGEDFLIYSKIVFNHSLMTITPHYKLKKKIRNITSKLKIERNVIENTSFTSILVNNLPYNVKILPISNDFPKKYHIYIDKILCGNFNENIHTHSWYDLNFQKEIPIEFKDKILKEMVLNFENSPNITSFSIIVDIDDASCQEMLLELKFQYHAFLPLYYGIKDGILLGLSKIR